MGQLAYTATTGLPLHQRIQAKLQAKVTWEDDSGNELVAIEGTTENIGGTSALVNMNVLPKVGSVVELRLLDEGNEIIETTAEVIRVERDPSRPQAALSITGDADKWQETALEAAQNWVIRDIEINYEGDDWLN